MAAAPARDATPTPPPPPLIGRAGRYTVFITPPATPRPSESPRSYSPSPSPSPRSAPPPPPPQSPAAAPSPPPRAAARPPPAGAPSPRAAAGPRAAAAALPPRAPPVQVPPKQFDDGRARPSSGSVFGFFWDAVAKVQNAHSSLDERLAEWFGLNQSKYQWALNDYYESKGEEKEGSRPKAVASKGQPV